MTETPTATAESTRKLRKTRTGLVVSEAMDKTVVVKVVDLKSHPMYKKVIRTATKFHAHDENNQCGVGDRVRIMETRPMSKLKRWRVVEILEKAR